MLEHVSPSFRRRWLWAAIGLLIVLAGARLVRWLGTEDETAASLSEGSTPSIQIIGAQDIVLSENGRKLWQVSARRIAISPDRLYVQAWQVKDAILFRDGKPFLRLQAEKVRVNQQTRDLEATGKVKAHGPDGFSLITSRALWKNASKLLECPQPVRATLRGVKIASARASYDTAQHLLRCPQPVRAVSRGVTYTARSATYNGRKQELLGAGGVRIVAPKAVLRGGDARIDIGRQTVQIAGPIEIVAQPGAAPALKKLVPPTFAASTAAE